jgi:hypothetical protein
LLLTCRLLSSGEETLAKLWWPIAAYPLRTGVSGGQRSLIEARPALGTNRASTSFVAPQGGTVGERVLLGSDGPGLNVAGTLVNGEDHAILGHQTVRHLEGRRHSALAEEAFA